MPLTLIEPPAAEPLTLPEARLFLKLDGAEDDEIVSRLIVAARAHAERCTGLAFITQRWRQVCDRWPEGQIEIGIAPVLSVDAVKVRDMQGVAATLDPATYAVDRASRPARIAPGGAWPKPGQRLNGIEIELTAGFGPAAADIPAELRQAMLMLIAHWHERRSPFEEAGAQPVPHGVAALLGPFKRARL